MAGLYFLQDTRSVVGNCMVFWAKDCCGYTTNLEDAHLFTLDEAIGHRSTDRPWPAEQMWKLSKPRVDVQDLPRKKVFPEKEMLPSYDSLTRRIDRLERKISGMQNCPACREDDE